MDSVRFRKDHTIKIGNKKVEFPHIGLRITKSAIAILLCYLISFLRGNSGLVFYSLLAALWCIQVYVSGTIKNAVQRFVGTCVGAIYGLLYLLLYIWCDRRLIIEDQMEQLLEAVAITFFIIVTLYTTVLLKKKEASYFSCVVFLSIVVNHVSDVNPYLFVANRFLDTVIGIIVGVCVNIFHLPRKKNQDILFISGVDDMLVDEKNHLSDYNRIELNRMIDDGAKFTISTMRTPASLLEPLKDIRLKLPVIAMDGAVLYDTIKKQYLKVYVMSKEKTRQIKELIDESGLMCFYNVIIDDMLVIFYEDTVDEVKGILIDTLRRSPFRNYVKRELPEFAEVVYFMLLEKTKVIEDFYETLKKNGILEQLKVLKYPSTDYKGYSYLKIYNKNASKENMIEYLKKQIGVEKTMTFGTIDGKYDVVMHEADGNQVVYRLRKEFEPVQFLHRDFFVEK